MDGEDDSTLALEKLTLGVNRYVFYLYFVIYVRRHDCVNVSVS